MVTMADLIHPTRVRLLNLLIEGPETLSSLAKSLELSKPEISRHLARLRDYALVERGDKTHQITNLGETIMSILSPLEFIVKHYEFFMVHQIFDLPAFIIRNLDSLMKSELLIGTGYIFSKMQEIQQTVKKEIKIAIDQPFPGNDSNPLDNIYFIVPVYAKDENLSLEALKKQAKYFEFRTLPIISYGFGIADEKTGFIFFPGINKKIDYNYAFFVSDPLGIDFLSQLWDYYWKRSDFRVSSKIIE
ncbi:MAG: ArsR family transcriptional regulator [Candidatus Heimdallarchaeota archaeon]